MLTQEQYLVLQQSTRRIEIKIELLNNNDVVVDALEGYSVSGNISMQADSAYRRSGSLKMVINNNDLLPEPDSKIWFNRKIRLNIGLKNWSDETIWFNQGVFVVQSASIDTSSSESTIDITISDLMSLVDGTMNGNLTHEVKIVPEGIKVSEALRSTLSQLGKVSIDNITINDADALVPYEISVQPNSSVYDLAKTLLDLYMKMEIFYDESGYLIVQQIKDRRNDPILWDFSAEGMNLTINHTNSISFSNVRNSVQIWGKKKGTGETIKWAYKSRFSRKTVAQMNAISSKDKGDICHVTDENLSYLWDDTWKALDWIVPVIFNVESIDEKPFTYIDEKITDIEQARLRAEYELKLRSNLAESVSLSILPIYGLEVNSKIKLDEKEAGIVGDYIVKSVSIGLSYGDSMSVQAEKIYY